MKSFQNREDIYHPPIETTVTQHKPEKHYTAEMKIRYFIPGIFLLLLISLNIFGQRKMENLDRGLVAVNSGGDVFLSWRMLGTENSNIGFNIYRNGTKINSSPITESTNYVDYSGNSDDSYYITSVLNGSESSPSNTVNVWNDQYLSIPLNRPQTGPNGGTYEPNDLSVGDLDGDGEYELVIKWYPSNAKDNSESGYTDNTYLEGIELDGTSLWRIDLGVNIRSGAHYTQFMVYDLDSDGKAEVACKTAPGTIDGSGNYLSLGPASGDDDGADYRNSSGYILEGPEYLTVFSGQTGEELATVYYIPERGDDINAIWGDSYGNRVDRFLACIAYLDGVNPSLVMCRGYYTRCVLAAFYWDGQNLSNQWVFDSDNGYPDYDGMGNHNLAVGDVDNDGFDEIMYGSCAIDHDGSGLYSTGLGHGDAGHLGDLNPDRPGLEFFMPHEWTGPGVSMRDAATGEIIWLKGDDAGDVGRGVAGDVCPGYRGVEVWAASGFGPYDAQGNDIDISPSSINFLAYWDGDVNRELLDGAVIDNMDAAGDVQRLLTASDYGASSVNGSKSTPGLAADILGDWREEVIWKHNDNSHLLLFTTNIQTDRKNYTLMHDPIYRLSIAWQNVGYNQPAHTGFYFPDGAPTPNITLVGGNSNNSPSVQITSPTDGSIFNEGEAIDISVNSSDSDGSISHVEFYADGVKLGEDYSSPYDYIWNNASAGEHTIHAVAVDNEGATSSSNIVSLVVLPANGYISITIQEYETGFCNVEGTIDVNHSGYTGSGFANTSNSIGSGIDYKLNVIESGTYIITVQYANGSTENREADILSNGSVIASAVEFTSTGDWDTWGESETSVYLNQGIIDLRLEASTSDGLANIDFITITGSAISRADCNTNNDDDNTGVSCDSPVSITAPFDQNGSGEFCWVITDEPSYINSWGLDVLTINEVDYTNIWSNSFPEPVNGSYYIYYKSSSAWSHFEISGTKIATGVSQNLDSDIKIFPNPFNSEITLEFGDVEKINRIEVLNSLGQVVHVVDHNQINQGHIQLNIEQQAGIYLLRVYTPNEILVNTVIKR